MWSMTWPTVQNGGTATKSVCMRRPAVSSGYSRLRSSAARSPVGICARISCRSGSVEALQDVGGVVGLELGDGLGQHVALGSAGSSWSRTLSSSSDSTSGSKADPSASTSCDALVGRQQLDQIGKIGRLQACDERARMRPPVPPRSASAMGLEPARTPAAVRVLAAASSCGLAASVVRSASVAGFAWRAHAAAQEPR